MNDKKDIVYLKHILNAIKRIEEYIKDKDYEFFITHGLLQDGVVRQLEIIGEASRRLSKDLIDKYPEVPWKDMIGMRNKLIHDYFGIDLDAVWETVRKDIPFLRKEIEKIIKIIES